MSIIYIKAKTNRYPVEVDENGCWIWINGRTEGYATLSYKNKTYRVSRLIYAKFFGKIPDGHWVCHKCDVSNCINPDHLFAGPPSINHQDFSFKAFYVSDGFNLKCNVNDSKLILYKELIHNLPVRTRVELSNKFIELLKKGLIVEKRHVLLDKDLYDRFAAHCKENYFPVKRGIELVLANALEAGVLRSSIKAFIATPSSNPRRHDLHAALARDEIKEMTSVTPPEMDADVDEILNG